MQKITKNQRALLETMALRPLGLIVRSPDGIADLKALATTGFVTDVYEMLGGGLFGKLSIAGRDMLNGK